MQEMPVRSLGQEEPLEKEMATHSSILGWEIPWTEEPGGLQSMESQRVRDDLATKQQQQSCYICKYKHNRIFSFMLLWFIFISNSYFVLFVFVFKIAEILLRKECAYSYT